MIDAVSNSYKEKRIICIFQPHRISRLNDLKMSFAHPLKKHTLLYCAQFIKQAKIIN